MTDRDLDLLFKVFLLALIGAFAPQLGALMRRLGYRSMKEQRDLDAKQ